MSSRGGWLVSHFNSGFRVEVQVGVNCEKDTLGFDVATEVYVKPAALDVMPAMVLFFP